MREHHLSEEQIIKSIVEINDLDPEASAHLGACENCQHQAEFFTKNLKILQTELANSSFPPKPDIQSIINDKPPYLKFKPDIFKPVAAFCIALIIVILGFSHVLFNPSTPDSAQNTFFSTASPSGPGFLLTFEDIKSDNLGLTQLKISEKEKMSDLDLFIDSLINYDYGIVDYNSKYPL